MKYEKKLSYLNVLLNVILAVLALPFIGILYIPFMVDVNMNLYLQFFIGIIFGAGYIMIILILKKILKSIRNRNPFNPDNIIYFKKIGYYILAVGVIYGIISYPVPNYSSLNILSTSHGSLKPTFFLHIVLSLLSFIVSDVFKMALEIKNENDLTV